MIGIDICPSIGFGKLISLYSIVISVPCCSKQRAPHSSLRVWYRTYGEPAYREVKQGYKSWQSTLDRVHDSIGCRPNRFNSVAEHGVFASWEPVTWFEKRNRTGLGLSDGSRVGLGFGTEKWAWDTGIVGNTVASVSSLSFPLNTIHVQESAMSASRFLCRLSNSSWFFVSKSSPLDTLGSITIAY